MSGLRLALAGVALVALACGPKYTREKVFEHRSLVVTLRAEVVDGERVERGFTHPTTISSVRIAHILSRIDVREGSEEGGERKPAFETVLLYSVGEQMALALATADSSQEVVVQVTKDLTADVGAWYFHSTPIWLLVMAVASVIFVREWKTLVSSGVDVKAMFRELPPE